MRALYVLDTLGMDIALYDSTVTADRLHYMRFSRDLVQYSHQARRPRSQSHRARAPPRHQWRGIKPAPAPAPG